MVLSRPENSIKNAFKKRQHTIRLKGEDETKALNHDISLVIQVCINDLKDSGIPEFHLTDVGQRLGAQLGEMSFYGTSRNCPWPYHLREMH